MISTLNIQRATHCEYSPAFPQASAGFFHRNHTVQYYQKSYETENPRKYIPKTNQKLIKSLAQKDYDEKILPNLELELYHLNTTLNYLQKNQIDKVYQELSASRRQLVTPITLPDKQFAENWLALEYPPGPAATLIRILDAHPSLI